MPEARGSTPRGRTDHGGIAQRPEQPSHKQLAVCFDSHSRHRQRGGGGLFGQPWCACAGRATSAATTRRVSDFEDATISSASSAAWSAHAAWDRVSRRFESSLADSLAGSANGKPADSESGWWRFESIPGNPCPPCARSQAAKAHACKALNSSVRLRSRTPHSTRMVIMV